MDAIAYLDAISLCLQVVYLLLLTSNLVCQLLLLVCQLMALAVQPPVNCKYMFSGHSHVLVRKAC